MGGRLLIAAIIAHVVAARAIIFAMKVHRNFTLVRSSRARRLSLHVHPERGLEAVVPARLGEARARREAEAFIERRARWIDRAIRELADRRAVFGTDGRLEINGTIPYGGRAHKIVATDGASIHVNDGAIEVPATIEIGRAHV